MKSFNVFIILCLVAAILGYGLDDLYKFLKDYPTTALMILGSFLVFCVYAIFSVEEK